MRSLPRDAKRTRRVGDREAVRRALDRAQEARLRVRGKHALAAEPARFADALGGERDLVDQRGGGQAPTLQRRIARSLHGLRGQEG
jgi:hypothetical protein